MNGIRWEKTVLARKAVRTKVVEPQSITGIIRHRREPPEANPLIAGKFGTSSGDSFGARQPREASRTLGTDLGTDLGTELRETAQNQCDSVRSVGRLATLEQCVCDNVGGAKQWQLAHNPEVAGSNPVPATK